jgi:putative transposase
MEPDAIELNANEVIAIGKEKPEHRRIVFIDSDADEVSTIEIYDPKSLPVWSGFKEVISLLQNDDAAIISDPFGYLNVPEDEIPDDQKEYRDERIRQLEPLFREENLYELLSSDSRGRAIRRLPKDVLDKNRKGVYRDVRKWLQRGMTPNALRPDFRNCGGRGKTRVTKENEKNFDKKLGRPSRITNSTGVSTGINALPKDQKIMATAYRRFVVKQGMTIAAAYLMMLLLFYFRRPDPSDDKQEVCVITPLNPEFQDWVLDKKRPTRHQFRYWAKKERIRLKGFSNRSEKRKVRQLIGRSFDTADYPTGRYQIDAWLADVYCVDPLDRSRILYRPIVYIVVDVYSHMIVGLYVTLLPPSWESAKIALCNAFTSKVEFCAQFGIEIRYEDWPTEHMCTEVYADRGETDTTQAEDFIKALQLHFINGPAYQPKLRGLVEGLFNLIRVSVVGSLPASVQKDQEYKPRRGKDYRLDASLTVYEITQILILFCIKYNHFHTVAHGNERELAMLIDGVEATPIDLWNWGKENKAGGLPKRDADVIRRNLLPKAPFSVGDKGLILKGEASGLQYTCDREMELRRNHKGEQLSVLYRPDTVDEVFLLLEGESEPCRLTLHSHSQAYQGFTFDQYKLVKDKADLQAALREENKIEADVRVLAEREALVKVANKLAKLAKAGKTKQELVSNIREQLQQARATERKQRAADLNQPDQPQRTDIETPPAPEPLANENGFNYVGPLSITELIKDNRK